MFPSIILTIIISVLFIISFPLSQRVKIPFRLRHCAVVIGGGMVFSYFFIIMIYLQAVTGRTTMLDFNKVHEMYFEMIIFSLFFAYQYVIFLSVLGTKKQMKVKK